MVDRCHIFSSDEIFSFTFFRSNPPKVFLGKGLLKICKKFTGEQPMPFNKLDLRLYWNHTLAWVFSCKFSACFSEHLFIRIPAEGCFCFLSANDLFQENSWITLLTWSILVILSFDSSKRFLRKAPP